MTTRRDPSSSGDAQPAYHRAARGLGGLLAFAATPIAIVGLALLLFFNPLWVGFEQDRTDVAGITGYTPAEVHAATGAILADVYFGPPTFDVTVAGAPVLDPAERSHMADVRFVLLRFLALVALALVALVALVAVAGRSAWLWRATAAGAAVLAGAVVLVGAAFAIAFDQAFLAFHELFFPQGNFEFNPLTERLVQLFPEQFFSETIIALALVVLVLAGAVAGLSLRRARLLSTTRAAATTGSVAAGVAGEARSAGGPGR